MKRGISLVAIAMALLGAACGGPAVQDQRVGDEATGEEQRSRGGVATSGGETGDAACSVEPVYFAYDSSELDGSARNALESDARCLVSRRHGARVVGMTDPRGTEEYNLALGD